MQGVYSNDCCFVFLNLHYVSKKPVFSFCFHFSCIISLYFCISPFKPLCLLCKFKLICISVFLGFVRNLNTSPFPSTFSLIMATARLRTERLFFLSRILQPSHTLGQLVDWSNGYRSCGTIHTYSHRLLCGIDSFITIQKPLPHLFEFCWVALGRYVTLGSNVYSYYE